MPDDVVPLGDGRYEERVAVDRRRLETMITGKPQADDDITLPNAELFFNEVISYSGAMIFWPTQLKIGAKTKRDPFVKVQGTLKQLEMAKSIIISTLHAKKERVTLKMEIHHGVHSHIIGKGGRGIQQIMKSTRCHIHFPDSNKFSEKSAKSDQVSISGPPTHIDSARHILRGISPILLSLELPWAFSGSPDLLPFSDNISWQSVSPTIYMCLVRGNAGDEMALLNSLGILIAHFRIPAGYPLSVRSTVYVKEELLERIKAPDFAKRLTSFADQLQVQLHIHDETIILSGHLSGVLSTRKMILGRTPISISFEHIHTQQLMNIQLIEKAYDVNITTKKRSSQSSNLLTIVIKTSEEYSLNALRAREELLGLSSEEYAKNEYYNGSDHHISALPSDAFSPSLFSSSFVFSPPSDSPKSPDPDNSPMAASILKGAKEIDRNVDRWNRKQPMDRGQMLVKAAQAVFDDTPRSRAVPRYPTDHWSGYGFSCSLPAELLKGMLEMPQLQEEQGRLIVGREAKTPPSRGLCAVREDDELSDFGGSFSSASVQSGQRNYANQRTAFSASTSIFDSAPLVSDYSWDIRTFTDPAMVLAQIGCSEYLVQMREQEIDMHAFLLLDEQNLKDIGVSTIGARKKIHHAIIKLRESARQLGYAI